MKGVPIMTSYLLIFTMLKYSLPANPVVRTVVVVLKFIFARLPTVPNCSTTGFESRDTSTFDISVKVGDITVDVLPLSHSAMASNPLMLISITRHCLSLGVGHSPGSLLILS